MLTCSHKTLRPSGIKAQIFTLHSFCSTHSLSSCSLSGQDTCTLLDVSTDTMTHNIRSLITEGRGELHYIHRHTLTVSLGISGWEELVCDMWDTGGVYTCTCYICMYCIHIVCMYVHLTYMYESGVQQSHIHVMYLIAMVISPTDQYISK